MDGKLHNEIISYSKSKEPQESCGFVVLVGSEKVFIPCENASEDKENHFEISPEDYIAASEKGEVLALVHSHPQGEPKLSQADLQTQLYSQLDFWLVYDEQIHIFPKIPFLIGRDFKHGAAASARLCVETSVTFLYQPHTLSRLRAAVC